MVVKRTNSFESDIEESKPHKPCILDGIIEPLIHTTLEHS